MIHYVYIINTTYHKLSVVDHDDNSLAKENEHIEIDCVPSNISLYNSF
ncbi:1292_t:CDS:2 [Funneliformis caledonium]|uniref:1292_t:CDS:1 n=1 Tax=Funneliformis caledonium TaxID=1117310 RepID=A0A9N8Z1F6_9GLOM|nr:1292_t:CDS:2 [Funneliformis caledonium]